MSIIATVRFYNTDSEVEEIIRNMAPGETVVLTQAGSGRAGLMTRSLDGESWDVSLPDLDSVHNADGVYIPIDELTDGMDVILEFLT